ncbi:MAG: tRNA 2-thiouridine(34) synthase MnmA [Candidatus Paceibacterota bacterium]
MNTAKTICVGLSGGVDSSVSAALLKDQGYDIVGVFIRGWYPDFIECSWKEDRRDAMRVCATLDIPFKECNLEDTYKKEVVDYMIEEYKAGRTPNPDVMCNQFVKFGAFLDWALEDGAGGVATGHYARIEEDNGEYQLLAGVDKNKDQSYFLWTLTQQQLSHIIFPVGGMEKSSVRKIAEGRGLITADKKDSQGLCFIGHVDIPEFLSHFIDLTPGEVCDTSGDVIGTHIGAEAYTIGQRHGFKVTKKNPDDGPHYVYKKDVENNRIYVTRDKTKASALFNASTLILEDVNWIPHTPEEGEYSVRTRYRQPLEPCKLSHLDGEWTITFDTPHKAVAQGQSCVLYKDDCVIGGGVISEILDQKE